MADIVIPSLGIAMEEALVVRWLKQPGDEVMADEGVAEIETDKAIVEVKSPTAGTLGAPLVELGAAIPVGTVIARVIPKSEQDATESKSEQNATEPDPVRVIDGSPSPLEAIAASTVETEGARRPHTLSPRARRLTQERDPGDGHRTERFRELIAAKVAEAWREIPHFAVTREVVAESMLAALDVLRARFAQSSPTLTDLLLRAFALALREAEHQHVVDVGLAVATDHGVVIPVVRDVLALDAGGLARARTEAVARARTGRLNADDLAARPHSTLSNLGRYGVDQFTGIIAVGQTSLLTIGRAVPRVVAESSQTLAIRTTLFATLNADHRAMDGAQAAQLLGAFATAAEGMTATFSEGAA
jgi:pyruvate dehydrogenase E2 component (dihydrolipoamide acetyltransferase)